MRVHDVQLGMSNRDLDHQNLSSFVMDSSNIFGAYKFSQPPNHSISVSPFSTVVCLGRKRKGSEAKSGAMFAN